MTWAKAKIEIKPASVGTGVKVSLKKIRGGAAKMSLSITGSAIADIGWADGDGIEVLIGEGEHHGLIRLRKNKSAAQTTVVERKAVRGGKYLAIPLGNQPAFVSRSEPAAWCQWEEVEDGWVEIVLPKWADETSPNRAKVAAVPQPVQPKPAPAPSRNVTADLMGDPPPNRREMLQKIGTMKA
jgi:hypothetical protein